jgi:hypothetical protein
MSKNGRARTAYLEPGTLALLLEQRERVRAIQREQKWIIPDVFVHVGKGKLQGKRTQRFRKAFYTAAAAADHPGVLFQTFAVLASARCQKRRARACRNGHLRPQDARRLR